MKIANSLSLLFLAASSTTDAWSWGSNNNNDSNNNTNDQPTAARKRKNVLRGLQQQSSSSSTSNRVKCLDDVVLLRIIGDTDFPRDVVDIVSQDTSTVTVNLNQYWSSESSIDSIFTYYHETAFDKHCYENTDVLFSNGNKFDTITISCSVLTPKVRVRQRKIIF